MRDWLFEEVRAACDKLKPSDFTKRQIATVVRFYEAEGVYMDYLPYTEAIDRIVAGFLSHETRYIRECDVHGILIDLRKSDKTFTLVKGKVESNKPKAPEWFRGQAGQIWGLYCDVRSKWAADELAYTPEFEDIWRRFLVRSSCQCSRALFNRLLQRIRKAGSETNLGRIRAEVEAHRVNAAMTLFNFVPTPN